MALTVREVKNLVLSALDANERNDSITGEVPATGGYIILTDYRVIEIYYAVGTVYVQERKLERDGWDDVNYTTKEIVFK